MGKLKVYYFDIKARGELIRLVLKASKIDFEDVRMTFDNWPELKKKSPSGQAPWVEMDGKILTESNAIARKFAFDNNLMGNKSSDDIYQIEKCMDQITDVKEEIYKLFFIPDAEEKEKKRQGLITGKGETILTLLEKDLKDNKGLLCKGKVSLADLYLLTLIDYLRHYTPELMDKHKGLNAYYDNVCKAVPEVGKWIKERPVTDK